MEKLTECAGIQGAQKSATPVERHLLVAGSDERWNGC